MKPIKNWINERPILKEYLEKTNFTDKELLALFNSCCIKSKINKHINSGKSIHELLDNYKNILRKLPTNFIDFDFSRKFSINLMGDNIYYIENIDYIDTELLILTEGLNGLSIIDLISTFKNLEIYPMLINITDTKYNEEYDLYDFIKENQLDSIIKLNELNKEIINLIRKGLLEEIEMNILIKEKEIEFLKKERTIILDKDYFKEN